jgi:hypothetical protein
MRVCLEHCDILKWPKEKFLFIIAKKKEKKSNEVS